MTIRTELPCWRLPTHGCPPGQNVKSFSSSGINTTIDLSTGGPRDQLCHLPQSGTNEGSCAHSHHRLDFRKAKPKTAKCQPSGRAWFDARDCPTAVRLVVASAPFFFSFFPFRNAGHDLGRQRCPAYGAHRTRFESAGAFPANVSHIVILGFHRIIDLMPRVCLTSCSTAALLYVGR